MSVARGIGTTALALTAMLAASSAWGDGECAKGYRDTTPAERATMTTVLETSRKALPPAPQGWVILGDDKVSVPTSLCKDYEDAPWQYAFTRYYQRVDDQEARNKKIEAAAADMAADMAKKQPRLDALTAKMQALGQELGAAAQKGDYARTDVINKELETISEEYKKILEEGDTTAKMEAVGAEVSRDVEINITVAVNSHYESPDSAAQDLVLSAGPRSAFRWSTPRGSVEEGHALVLLGQWKPRAEGGMESVARANVAMPAAHAISIHVTADENRLAPTVNSIDFSTLTASLLQ